MGHINPLIHFCLKLAHHGILVTFVTIHVDGFLGVGQRKDPEVPEHWKNNFNFERLELELPKEGVMSPGGFAKIFAMIEELGGPFEELLSKLHSREEIPKVSCIVSDCMLVFTQVVAKKLGIPRAGFWTTSLASLTVDYHVPLLLENGDIPVTGENWEKIITYVPGLAPLPAWSLPIMYHEGNIMTTTDPGYKRKIARCVILRDDAWIIANSFEELEPAGFQALRKAMNQRCIGVGPLLPDGFFGERGDYDEHRKVVAPGVASFWKQDTTCLKWLAGKAPNSVLYISFGSVIKLTLPEFEELSRGLESSKQAFLWAFRPGCVEGLEIEELESFKERTSSTGLVISWAPQVEVLSHESTGGFLTHCGWNSVLEGICGGVPMLGWPRQAEQNINCELFVGMGIGLRLVEANQSGRYQACPTSDVIASKVSRVLGDEGLRKRAGELRDSARRAVKNQSGSTTTHVEGFVRYLYGESLS
ncbi:7-deoxyloganetin glucosyltransferase isoform X2 [Selaginella moellendorffii]|uniref:7-deoxyloganetin glucosyltransferase isoform X2 n=1 Tax=Selaginella moellendorffii TaxID=88036 RepID=UPI000D1C3DA1|nr:7-deoxyloganetin glucosyltransferase isoform X2 [Selaginella moellendorffii]|eukprot:XP_024539723.1 7-deoxyloganetin glucosyltransferase isoform X2 [Selaginella moellendorffii]